MKKKKWQFCICTTNNYCYVSAWVLWFSWLCSIVSPCYDKYNYKVSLTNFITFSTKRKYLCRQYYTEYQKIFRIPFQLSYFYWEFPVIFYYTLLYDVSSLHYTCNLTHNMYIYQTYIYTIASVQAGADPDF